MRLGKPKVESVYIDAAFEYYVMDSDSVKIRDLDRIEFKEPVAVEGFPGAGLVGAIAASYMITKLGLKHIASIESSMFPPFVALHKGEVYKPVRIYAKEDLIAVISEIPLPSITFEPLIKSLLKWFSEKGVKVIVSFDGFADPKRIEAEQLSIFGVSNSKEYREVLEKSRIKVMREGFITGIKALILRDSLDYGIPAVTLLAQSYANYPDPGAAGAILEAFESIFGFEIDTEQLFREADEIKVKLKELMRSTAAVTPVKETGLPAYIG